MKSIVYESKHNKLNLFLFGDIHFGSTACAKDKLKKLIKTIQKDKYARAILMGDLIEAIAPSDKRFDLDSVDPLNSSIEDQVYGIYKILEPIKHKIIGLISGNHEYKIKKHVGIDISRMLSNMLNVPYLGYGGLISVAFKNKTHRILVHHGRGGSRTIGGVINVLKGFISAMDKVPDICAVGHFHKLDTIIMPRLTDTFKTQVKYLAITGSFFDTYSDLEHENYAQKMFYNPLPVGCVMFELFNDGSIKDNKVIL